MALLADLMCVLAFCSSVLLSSAKLTEFFIND